MDQLSSEFEVDKNSKPSLSSFLTGQQGQAAGPRRARQEPTLNLHCWLEVPAWAGTHAGTASAPPVVARNYGGLTGKLHLAFEPTYKRHVVSASCIHHPHVRHQQQPPVPGTWPSVYANCIGLAHHGLNRVVPPKCRFFAYQDSVTNACRSPNPKCPSRCQRRSALITPFRGSYAS